MVKIQGQSTSDLSAEDIINLVGLQAVKRGVAQLPLSEKNSFAVKLGVPTDTSSQHVNSLILAHLSSRCKNGFLVDGQPVATQPPEDQVEQGMISSQSEAATVQRKLAAVLEAQQVADRKRQETQKELAKCKSECEALREEVLTLRQKLSVHEFPPGDTGQGLADRVSELQQENIVLGALYRNACRRIERLEANSDREQQAQPHGAAGESGEASPQQQHLNEAALPLEECRKLCPATSVQARTAEWVQRHSWMAAQELAAGQEGASDAPDSSHHGFLSGSMSGDGEDPGEETPPGDAHEEDDALRGRGEGAASMSPAVPLTGYRGNPVNRVARAAWKKGEFGGFAAQGASASPAGPNGYDVLGSLLGGMSKARRKEVDIAVFDP